MSKKSHCYCCCPRPYCGGYGYNLGMMGGYQQGSCCGGYSGNCCDFSNILLLLLIALQFSPRSPLVPGTGEPINPICCSNNNGIIDNSILFLLAFFYLICCRRRNCCNNY